MCYNTFGVLFVASEKAPPNYHQRKTFFNQRYDGSFFFNQLSLGHTAMEEFCTIFGTQGLHLKTFQEKEKHIIDAIISNAGYIIEQSVGLVKTLLLSS